MLYRTIWFMALSEQEKKDIKQLLGRDPSTVEYYIFDTMWSEHCSYKSSKSTLKQLPTKGSEVALGIGEDSGIIRFHQHNGKQYCIAISHESHNHPSQILPIEGAATGVGGCVRDVYCMGADVIGVLNSLHFGIPESNNSSSLVDEIAEKVVHGIADYGNPLGVPVLGGETLYHESYNDNCLVNVAALGLLTEDNIVHSYVPKNAEHEQYDIILFGKPTDATGFGGASFSSATLDDEDEMTNLGAVQVHDPFLKRVLAEAIKVLLQRVKEKDIEIGFKDLGAGGISCAASEIAVGGGFGVEINLDQVNVAFKNLAPEVIACSETQERFCLAVPSHFSKEAIAIFNEEFDIPKLYPHGGAAVIGKVTKEKTFKIYHQNSLVCDLAVESITTEVKATRHAEHRLISKQDELADVTTTQSLKSICEDFIQTKNNTSKRYVYRFFDNAVRGDTVVYPGEADAVVIAPIKDSETGLAVTMDSNLYGLIDPYVAGAAAVAESIRNVVAMGGRPIALTDCLNYGNPEKPPVFFDFQEGVKGIKEAAESLSFIDNEPVPIISGNVSFYNESTQGSAVTPSPVICCVGKVDHINQSKSMQCFEAGLSLFLVGQRHSEFAGTQIEPYLTQTVKTAPQVRFDDELKQNKFIYTSIQQKLVEVVHDISMGGLFQTVVEMILGERGYAKVGAELQLENQSLVTTLFSENGGYVIATKNSIECNNLAKRHGVELVPIGTTTRSTNLIIQNQSESITLPIDQLVSQWNHKNN
ncbi:phosphoribosylformylglycinamidine synthase subunit PurL [Candidatus Marinamargulisbacteria bacterium SCGC AG-414-C22]|nr:phosphoribosylformylglycinamidine synthase subunit PurL [Candidatus Marinamargulisbacteria bacterium SCGC AG-414-C22]